jgi:hypothetical protein
MISLCLGRKLATKLTFASHSPTHTPQVHPSTPIQPEVAHELQRIAQVALEDVDLGPHHTPRLENDSGTGNEDGVVDEDLEEGRIPVVESVEVNTFDEDDRADEARRGPVFVPVQRECEGVVERSLKFCNVAIDYFQSFEIHGPSV